MTMEQVVPAKEQVPLAEPVSTEGEKPPEGEAQPQPLTAEQEAKVQQMVADATAKAIAEAKEIGRKELQSQQDRNAAEAARVERRAKVAEGTLGGVRQRLQELDPDVAKDLELSELKAEREGRATFDQEEAARQAQAAFHEQFFSGLNQFIVNAGVDPKDERIDWANDAPDYLTAQRRVLDSIAKIQKGNEQTMKEGFEKRLKDLETKVAGGEEEANSVNTAASQGAIAGSDAEFIKKFASAELPMTKANVDRYDKITSSY